MNRVAFTVKPCVSMVSLMLLVLDLVSKVTLQARSPLLCCMLSTGVPHSAPFQNRMGIFLFWCSCSPVLATTGFWQLLRVRALKGCTLLGTLLTRALQEQSEAKNNDLWSDPVFFGCRLDASFQVCLLKIEAELLS